MSKRAAAVQRNFAGHLSRGARHLSAMVDRATLVLVQTTHLSNACVLLLALAGCSSPEPEQKTVSSMPASQPTIIAAARDLGAHRVGTRVTLLATTSTGGQYFAVPPASHPVVTHVRVGDYEMPVYSKEELPAALQQCSLRIIGILESERGPVKDGSRAGRIYEPRLQYHLLVDRWECDPRSG